jgi:hypothetical protein
MEKPDFLKLMQRYVANIAISGSTLRNQGAKGVIEATRDFLAKLDLSKLQTIQPSTYPGILNEWTDSLKEALPPNANHWGTARKAINVFMVQVFLNRYLAEEYGLNKFDDVLETSLDSQAAHILRKRTGRGKLPRWNGIKRLRPEESARYQEFAAKRAKEEEIPRACLDIQLWRAEK